MVVQNIEQIIASGFVYSDICILVRKNKEGVIIAEHLNEMQIPVLSFEALLVANSNRIGLLTNFMNFVYTPNDKRKKLDFIKSLVVILSVKNQHEFISSYLSFSFAQMEEALQKININIDFNCFNTQPIYEAFESLVRVFNFNNRSDANVQFFMDFVFEYSQNKNSGLASFINLWNQKKDKLSIVVPEGKNAVQIMSIHKSKGLEFPVIIYPYADTEIYKTPSKNVWFPINEYSSVFSEAYISYNKKIFENYTKETQLISNEIRELQELDSFNVLYVALTRAREQLYVISNKKESKNKQLPEGSFQSYFIPFVSQNKNFNNSNDSFYLGEKNKSKLEKTSLSELTEISYKSTGKEESGIHVISNTNKIENEIQQSKDWGILIHDVMANIFYRKDVDEVLKNYKVKLNIPDKEYFKLNKTIKDIFAHKKLKDFFNENNEVFNEREFVYNNEILRPDRIEIYDEDNASIIDYKTGVEDVKNINQIRKYAAILEDLGYSNVKKMLIYANETIKILEF